MLSCKGSGTTIVLMQNVKYTKRSLIFHMGKNLPFDLLKRIKAAACLFETTHEGAFTFQHFILQWLALFAKIILLRK